MAIMHRPGKPEEKQNINPFSGKGSLTFGPFVWTLFATVVVNLIVYAMVRGGLIPVRATLDKEKAAIFYVIWFILSVLGFTVIANSFIKRWADILGEPALSSTLRSVIRFCLLSPLIAFPMTFATFAFFPGSPFVEVPDGGSKGGALGFLGGVIALSLVVALFLPNSFFGLERAQFRDSTTEFVNGNFNAGKNPFPSENVLKPALAAATPAFRYLAWMASDFVRTRMLNSAIDTNFSTLCAEKMGFLHVEVKDCYFKHLRIMATKAPMVSPYFALYFETEYRRAANEARSAESRIPMDRFADSLLMVSNMVELLEPGPMFVERTHLLRPSILLHAFASPEFPLVEAGQDIQRLAMIQKILPVIRMQTEAIEAALKAVGQVVGPDEVSIRSELRDIQIRVQAIQKDPLMIGSAER